MRISESFSMALKNIRASKMRTFLTMLGIIIGVSAVILIMGIGNGMKQYMEASFAEMGTNIIEVGIKGRGSSRNVSVDDMYQLVEDNPTLLSQVSPTVSMGGKVRIGTEESKYTTVTGVSESYFSMRDLKIAEGRGLQYVDSSARKHICVIGAFLAQTFYHGDALGKTIRVGTSELTIVGVMPQQADTMKEGGKDDSIYMPYTTAARLSSVGNISTFVFTIVNEETAVQARKAVENALFDVYRSTDSYTVVSMTEMLEMMNDMIDVNITILSVIAGISLVVGGIGIMNIMLVSVTERTREIGIRKALGAKERFIMQQFVMEAATTSVMGGVVGILFGYFFSAIGSVLISQLAGEQINVTPTMGSIMTAVGVSAMIGIIFGYLPAKKAARLSPIDALRYD